MHLMKVVALGENAKWEEAHYKRIRQETQIFVYLGEYSAQNIWDPKSTNYSEDGTIKKHLTLLSL